MRKRTTSENNQLILEDATVAYLHINTEPETATSTDQAPLIRRHYSNNNGCINPILRNNISQDTWM